MAEEFLVRIAILATAGVIVGYASGLFGIGGGVILVPTFLTTFPRFGASPEVVMHCAVGTCLALVVPAAIASTRKHYALGNVELDLLRSWLPWVALGTLVGVLTVELLRARDLKMIFTLYLIATTLYVAARKASEAGEEGRPPAIVRAVGGSIIGDLSVWLGLGGGTFAVPFFRAFHYPIKKSIAVSAATGLVIGFGGAAGAIYHGWGVAGRTSYSIGYVDGMALAVIGPIVMLTAPLGAKAASGASEMLLKWVYVALLGGIAAYMAVRTF
ncbi:MAG: sulfite exporter TauE/SafE family protein [Polyangiales bacterium]